MIYRRNEEHRTDREMKENNYYMIDVAKFVFACLIPLLHIPFTANVFIDIVRQYIARLGVPFFFATTGFLISEKIEITNRCVVCKRNFQRVGKLWCIWVTLYIVPSLLLSDSFVAAPIRTLLFLTPAYLWYLTAVLFGIIPFCLIKSHYIKLGVAVFLYCFGTLFSDSYSWMTGSIPLYNEIFLTYRNGMFFAFPIMCVGELVYRYKPFSKKTVLGFVVAFIVFCCEVTCFLQA